MTKRPSMSNQPAVMAIVACLGVAACGTSDPTLTGSAGMSGGAGSGGTGLGAGGAGGSGMGDLSQLLPIKT